MTNELEQKAYEGAETSDTSTRQGMSGGKKVGCVATGITMLALAVGSYIAYDIGKSVYEGIYVDVPNKIINNFSD